LDKASLYSKIIDRIFHTKFRAGAQQVDFERADIERFAKELGVRLPKNLGDLIYSFRYRKALPADIRNKAGRGKTWAIKPAGRSKYRFVLVPDRPLVPNENLTTTKVPDSTPGLVVMYAQDDEQALLAKVRYNRLIDIFTGVTCYSLQNHLRTAVHEMGQVETDELYVGVDKKGSHYIVPVQAKGGKDRLNIVQIEQDMAVCAHKFPLLICRPVAAQFMDDGVIALFEFAEGDDGVGIAAEKHYKLVPPDELTEADLKAYRERTQD
jgi:hypothetical protein